MSIALSELFLVARRFRQIGRSNGQSSNNYHSGSFLSDDRLPSWFNNNSTSGCEIIDTTVKHLVLNNSFMCGINQLRLNDLSSVYSDFFQSCLGHMQGKTEMGMPSDVQKNDTAMAPRKHSLLIWG